MWILKSFVLTLIDFSPLNQFGIRISDEDRESLINIPVIRFFAFSFDDLNLLCDKFHYLFSGQKSVKMILF
jgi:hypothetical protein